MSYEWEIYSTYSIHGTAYHSIEMAFHCFTRKKDKPRKTHGKFQFFYSRHFYRTYICFTALTFTAYTIQHTTALKCLSIIFQERKINQERHMVSFSSFIQGIFTKKKTVIKNPHVNPYKSHIDGAWATCV
jgi:hypothetical protein